MFTFNDLIIWYWTW